MSVFSEAAKNTMLDALTADRVRLHDGDPGASGTANELGSLETAAFSAASGSERALDAPVEVTGLSANQSVTWFSVWNSSGPVFLGKGEITSGDTAANAAGEFTLTTATKLQLTDE